MAELVGTQFVIAPDGGSAKLYTAQAENTDTYLLKTNNLSDIPNKNLARQNLGITVSSTEPPLPSVNDLWIDLDS